jgi:hypothetical protein
LAPLDPAAMEGKAWETDIRISNIICEKCTLQIIQWMAEHTYNKAGGYTYHHCADVRIEAGSKQPTDMQWADLLKK